MALASSQIGTLPRCSTSEHFVSPKETSDSLPVCNTSSLTALLPRWPIHLLSVLCSLGWPQIHYVAKASLELNAPASSS